MASEDWPVALFEDFGDVPRVCRLILGVYEEDITKPEYADHLVPENVVKKLAYADTAGKCPPYMVYVDHGAKDVALVVRGLHLANASDYAILFNNRKGQQMFDGGYVHHGLLNVAIWLLEKEIEPLKVQLAKHPDYTLTLGGHSLGSGVVSLLTIMIVNNLREFPTLTRDKVRCYAVAPARSMSMNLAVKYADVINSIVLQDDFLPRTVIPLQVIFGAAFCLPCLMAVACVKDTMMSTKQRLKDPRRLYAPGRLYHIVYSRSGSCAHFPPEVRSAIPVGGRFEHLVCSATSTDDHSLVTIEAKVTSALQEMEAEALLNPPVQQKMQRTQGPAGGRESREDELRTAMQCAVDLGVRNAAQPDDHPVLGPQAQDREGEEEGETEAEAEGKGEGEGEAEGGGNLRQRFLRAVLQKEEEQKLVWEEQEKAEKAWKGVSALNRWNALIEKVGMKAGRQFPSIRKEKGLKKGAESSSRWKSAAMEAKAKAKEGGGEDRVELPP